MTWHNIKQNAYGEDKVLLTCSVSFRGSPSSWRIILGQLRAVLVKPLLSFQDKWFWVLGHPWVSDVLTRTFSTGINKSSPVFVTSWNVLNRSSHVSVGENRYNQSIALRYRPISTFRFACLPRFNTNFNSAGPLGFVWSISVTFAVTVTLSKSPN